MQCRDMARDRIQPTRKPVMTSRGHTFAGDERDSISLAIVGSGGAGALTVGALLLDVAARAGWYGLMTRSVGPQIRGGEAAALLRLAAVPVECMAASFDLIIAIDWRNAGRFAAEMPLSRDGLAVGDPRGGEVPEAIMVSGAERIDIAMKNMAKDIPDGRPNMIALGIAAGLLGLPQVALFEVMEKRLADKGKRAVAASRAAIEAGFSEAGTIKRTFRLAAPDRGGAGRWLITGNEATGLGAVRGGIRFAAAYPITPATEILEWLAPVLSGLGGALVQAEDELGSVNMAIGASFGGKPALTATSGPGLALMIESLGLATAAEVPILIIDVMRGGPSTGIPTKSEQSDLNIAVYGCHGDAPHIVVAPLSVGDCLFTTQWAVHLAEATQTPAIVLSDQFLGQARAVIDRPADVAFLATRRVAERSSENAYCRYAVTADGVSPMALPGMAGGQYTADGLTHNSAGLPSSQAHDHHDQLAKRRRKIEGFAYGHHWANIEGDGDVVLLTWGSLTGAAREAQRLLAAQGIATRLVALRLLSPLQTEALAEALTGAERVLVIEQSEGAQFHRHLRAQCDLPGEVRRLSRAGPRLIGPEEICAAVRAWRS
jgi:2-oxoglutarate ferredoxin oxidoreductase subunit alpha